MMGHNNLAGNFQPGIQGLSQTQLGGDAGRFIMHGASPAVGLRSSGGGGATSAASTAIHPNKRGHMEGSDTDELRAFSFLIENTGIIVKDATGIPFDLAAYFKWAAGKVEANDEAMARVGNGFAEFRVQPPVQSKESGGRKKKSIKVCKG